MPIVFSWDTICKDTFYVDVKNPWTREEFEKIHYEMHHELDKLDKPICLIIDLTRASYPTTHLWEYIRDMAVDRHRYRDFTVVVSDSVFYRMIQKIIYKTYPNKSTHEAVANSLEEARKIVLTYQESKGENSKIS